jgi:hypothetical protein
MPSRNHSSHLAAVLLFASAQTAIAFAAMPTEQAAGRSVQPMLAASAPASTPISSALATKPGSLSSAKTVRELIEIDDKIALKKEKAALAQEEAKEKASEPNLKKPVDGVEAKPPTRLLAVSTKNEAAKAASIKVEAIMGLDGSRVVTGMMGNRAVSFTENSRIATNGWHLVSLVGQCAVFQKAEITGQSDEQATKLHTQSGAKRGKPVAAGTGPVLQTACFAAPAAMPAYPANGSAFASSALPRPSSGPVPLPMYSPSSTQLPVAR